MSIQPINPILPLWGDTAAEGVSQPQDRQVSLFSDILQSAIDNVKETEAVKNDAEYRLATGQLDNPAELTVASTQWGASVELLVQLRTRALDAYSELMRISM